MADKKSNKKTLPPQHQTRQPGRQSEMKPKPKSVNPSYKPSERLAGKVAIITGGDSGIGRAVALTYALEGASVVIVYFNEHKDAKRTMNMLEDIGNPFLCLSGDIAKLDFCKKIVKETVKKFKKIDILVNNAGEQHVQKDFLKISPAQLLRTFQTNIFAMFYLTQAALPYMKKGSCIINTTSITAYKGHIKLIDYSATKGAVVTFTRSLSQNLVKKGIRVNAVAPGPIWTPLIPSTFSAKDVEKFGGDTPMERPGEPGEIAPCYVFLATQDSSYITGQVLHPNGGTIVNG